MKISTIVKITVVLSMVFGLAVVTPHVANAVCDGGGLTDAADTDCAKETAFEFNGKTKDVSIYDLFVTVLRFLSVAVGIAVVIGIIIGGIMYSTSAGNPAQSRKGITYIVNAVIALVLYFLMFAIINFLVPGGVIR